MRLITQPTLIEQEFEDFFDYMMSSLPLTISISRMECKCRLEWESEGKSGIEVMMFSKDGVFEATRRIIQHLLNTSGSATIDATVRCRTISINLPVSADSLEVDIARLCRAILHKAHSG